MSILLPATQLQKPGPLRTVVLASLGSAFELYDFIVYGVFAREIGSAFFPNSDPVSNLLGTYAVFAVGYIARPIGGQLLGGLGDRIGRRAIFLFSMFAMSAATFAIGLVPGYGSIGIAAPILLVLLRITQGVFLAGELPCSIVYVVEEMPKRAGFASATVIACAIIGIFVATLVSLFIHTTGVLGDSGWRAAFVIGGVLGLLSLRFRSSLEESEEFRNMKAHVSKNPFKETISKTWRQVLVGIGVASIVNTSNSGMFVVLPSFYTLVLHYPPAQVSLAQNSGILVNAIVILAVGWMTDLVPARYLHRIGAVLLMFGAYPLYHSMTQGQVSPMTAYLILGATTGFVTGTYAYLLADLFPTRIRFSGVALSLNLATVIFTALPPFTTTLVLKWTGMAEAPGIVLAITAALAGVAGLCVRPLSGRLRAEA